MNKYNHKKNRLCNILIFINSNYNNIINKMEEQIKNL